MEVLPVDSVIDLVGDAKVVLLGEASHGTHEFYEIRAELTKRLVAERGFEGVAEASGSATVVLKRQSWSGPSHRGRARPVPPGRRRS